MEGRLVQDREDPGERSRSVDLHYGSVDHCAVLVSDMYRGHLSS